MESDAQDPEDHLEAVIRECLEHQEPDANPTDAAIALALRILQDAHVTHDVNIHIHLCPPPK